MAHAHALVTGLSLSAPSRKRPGNEVKRTIASYICGKVIYTELTVCMYGAYIMCMDISVFMLHPIIAFHWGIAVIDFRLSGHPLYILCACVCNMFSLFSVLARLPQYITIKIKVCLNPSVVV